MSAQTADVDADGFTRVAAKGRRNRSSKASSLSLKQTVPDSSIDTSSAGQGYATIPRKRLSKKYQQRSKTDVELQVEDVKVKLEVLRTGKFSQELQTCVDVVNLFGPEEIVCYGIGSLASQVSQWQLALVLLINQYVGVDTCAFDPVTLATDIETFHRFGISMIAENEEAKRVATKRTLFFMPHCEQFLYDNVLAANWEPDQLARVLIIGNHLARYKDIQSGDEFAKNSPFISRVLPHVTCTDLPSEKLLNLRHCPFAFTDTCLQQFRTNSETIDRRHNS
ncbi:hypothetical protein GGI02_004083 [Coemansia sp. RSA 2322]|nr:hypothetical protein GGI02_004083 [Coemansia sp. RSA 2322]